MRFGHEFMQKPKPLRRHDIGEPVHTRDIASRLVQTGDKAKLDRIDAKYKDDRDCRSRHLDRKCCGKAPGYNYSHVTANQFGRQFR